MHKRRLSLLDKLICEADSVMKTITNRGHRAHRPSPSQGHTDSELSASKRKHIAGLMRVNHTGEVCAQALYQGQALTAKLPAVRKDMQRAAQDEIDHLVWCEERLRELGSHTSYLNPAWYGMSFAIGAIAGAISDKVSLGFVAATEEQVCNHLRDHLKQLPDEDRKSQLILQQMLVDEQRHAESALQAGGSGFPIKVKDAMTAVSRFMTSSSYRI